MAGPKIYRLSPRAESDLEDIWLYTQRHWSEEQADHYVSLLVSAFEGLAAGTRHGRAALVLPDFQKYPCGAHMICFLDHGECLDIIRILHKRQDAPRQL